MSVWLWKSIATFACERHWQALLIGARLSHALPLNQACCHSYVYYTNLGVHQRLISVSHCRKEKVCCNQIVMLSSPRELAGIRSEEQIRPGGGILSEEQQGKSCLKRIDYVEWIKSFVHYGIGSVTAAKRSNLLLTLTSKVLQIIKHTISTTHSCWHVRSRHWLLYISVLRLSFIGDGILSITMCFFSLEPNKNVCSLRTIPAT